MGQKLDPKLLLVESHLDSAPPYLRLNPVSQMPQALSKEAMKRKMSWEREQLYESATEAWLKACEEASHSKAPLPSIGKVATQFPGVDRTTLWRRLKHSQDSKQSSAAKQGLLTPTESQCHDPLQPLYLPTSYLSPQHS
jgi:hypothetical protein